MPVVSNTSPILNLAIIEKLDLLRQQFRQLVIPPAVFNELKPMDNLPGSHFIAEAVQSGWLTIQNPANHSLIRVLRRELDEGESEAIALALETGAQRILLDEREGRRIAKALGLKITGILGILLHEKQHNESFSIEDVLNDLIHKAGFRIAPDLIDRILKF